MKLTQKETSLLKDLSSHEELCIEKYNRYSSEACDGQLKNLFSDLGRVEMQHLETLTQIQNGTVPPMNQGGAKQMPVYTQSYTAETQEKEQDKFLCTDALSTEKEVSSVYNTCIFEFTDAQTRDVLNHIQKEEQEHGEKIFNYMSANGMYQVQ